MIITHKIAALTATLATAMSFVAAPAMAFSVTQTSNLQTLKDNLLGTNTAGLSNFSLSITGNAEAFGTFTGDPFGLGSGIVLSTGRVAQLPGSSSSFVSSSFGTPGDLAELNLSFFADSTAEKLFFNYVFGSEEFPEFGGSGFNDSFELLLNGTNLAKLTDGKAVTINNLVPSASDRSQDNPDFIDNSSGLAASIIKLDGLTKVLGFEGLLKKNDTNVVTFRIKDMGDSAYDSAVLVQGKMGTVEPEPVPEPMTMGGLMAGGAMLAAGRKLRDRRK